MRNNAALRIIPLALVATLSVACTPRVVRESAPSIEKTLGNLEEPSADVLPIIRSEPVAINPERAAENYRKLLELAPDDETRFEAQRRLADLQVQMEDARGNTEESEEALQESIQLYNELLYAHPNDPENARIFYQMARAQQNLGDTEAAIDTLERLTQRHPESSLTGDAHFRRAELLFALRRYAEAEAEYATVMAMGGDTQFFDTAEYKYGWSLYKQSKYEQAITTFLVTLDRELPEGEAVDPETALNGVAIEQRERVRDSLRVITLSLSTLGGGRALNDYLTTHGDPRFYPMLYIALGDALLEKERYSDSAQAFAAFIQRYPASEYAPDFQTRVIAAYADGGFRDLVITEKERYAVTYDPAAPYWKGQAASDTVMLALRGHLEDLAKHHHALAQQMAQPQAAEAGKPAPAAPSAASVRAAFLVAGGWYRRIIELYPQDPELPEINFLLADALLDGGNTLEAAEQYDVTAYAYADYPRAGEAAYASVLAYRQVAEAAPAESQTSSLRTVIDSSIKLADTFDQHPQKYPVLTQAAQDLYTLNDYATAVTVAGRVIEAPIPVDETLRRVSWSVVGDSQFALAHYPEAEKAYAQELALTPADSSDRADIVEQLAASIYKQGETASDAGDMQAAAYNFLRVGKVTPSASIRATAEYDGATALLSMERWSEATQVLESFRRLFPGHELEADVDKKLAVAYQKDGKPAQSAGAFSRIARRTTETADTRREAAWLAATLYEESGDLATTATAYTFYVENFPRPLARALDARSKLVAYARSSGDSAQLRRWLQELVRADETAGEERSGRSQSLAAESSLDLGRMAAAEARGVPLTLPIEASLPRKNKAMEQAIEWLGKAAGYGFAETTTAATFELGAVYADFGKALMNSQRPRGLDELELEQYELLLEEQAYPFEEQAISTHETNLRRIADGLYNPWIAQSAKALATMVPARYGKLEQGEDRYETLQ